jgi:hypothetical protein
MVADRHLCKFVLHDAFSQWLRIEWNFVFYCDPALEFQFTISPTTGVLERIFTALAVVPSDPDCVGHGSAPARRLAICHPAILSRLNERTGYTLGTGLQSV